MSPFITAYVNLSALVPLPPAYVAFLGGSVASASAGDPATVTSSPNATVMLIIRPVPYVPLALADVTFSTDCAWAAGSARDRRGCGAAALSHTPPPSEASKRGESAACAAGPPCSAARDATAASARTAKADAVCRPTVPLNGGRPDLLYIITPHPPRRHPGGDRCPATAGAAPEPERTLQTR